jgi:hypothetical protein
MEYARPGDGVVVWRRDRLGRNPIHILETVKALSTSPPPSGCRSTAIRPETSRSILVLAARRCIGTSTPSDRRPQPTPHPAGAAAASRQIDHQQPAVVVVRDL